MTNDMYIFIVFAIVFIGGFLSLYAVSVLGSKREKKWMTERRRKLDEIKFDDDSPSASTSSSSQSSDQPTDTMALVKHLITEKLNAEEFAMPEMEEIGPHSVQEFEPDEQIVPLTPKNYSYIPSRDAFKINTAFGVFEITKERYFSLRNRNMTLNEIGEFLLDEQNELAKKLFEVSDNFMPESWEEDDQHIEEEVKPYNLKRKLDL